MCQKWCCLFLIISSESTGSIGSILEGIFIECFYRKYVFVGDRKYTEETRGPKASKSYMWSFLCCMPVFFFNQI